MFTFNAKTSESVKNAIIKAYNSGARVRVWYGDTVTGEAWLEEYDVSGKIGKSAGEVKIPLLIKNSRAFGGCGLLDSSIVRIDNISSRSTIYKHPTFSTGDLVECVPTSAEYLEAVSKNGETVAQFKKLGQAAKWIGFMTGKRYAK